MGSHTTAHFFLFLLFFPLSAGVRYANSKDQPSAPRAIRAYSRYARLGLLLDPHAPSRNSDVAHNKFFPKNLKTTANSKFHQNCTPASLRQSGFRSLLSRPQARTSSPALAGKSALLPNTNVSLPNFTTHVLRDHAELKRKLQTPVVGGWVITNRSYLH